MVRKLPAPRSPPVPLPVLHHLLMWLPDLEQAERSWSWQPTS
jgi:hypothetical protein